MSQRPGRRVAGRSIHKCQVARMRIDDSTTGLARGVCPRTGHGNTTQQGGLTILVLSRRLGEKIVIGDNICITVVDIDRGKIRLGIEAPRDVPIYRQELLPLGQQLRPESPAPTPA